MEQNNTNLSKRKRHRRLAAEIARLWKCQFPNCGKSYGTLGALKTHIKLKHPNVKNLMSLVTPLQTAELDPGCVLVNQIPLGSSNIRSYSNNNNSNNVNISNNKSLVGNSDINDSNGSCSISDEFILRSWPANAGTSSLLSTELLQSLEPDLPLCNSDISSEVNGSTSSSDEFWWINEYYIPILQLQIGKWVKTSMLNGDIMMNISLERKNISLELVLSHSPFKWEISFDQISRFSIEGDNETTVLVIEAGDSRNCTVENLSGGNMSIVWDLCDDFTSAYSNTISCYVVHAQRALISGPLQRLLKAQPRLQHLVHSTNTKACNKN